MTEIRWLELLQSDPKAQQVELNNCKVDPWRFLTHWLFTIDTNDSQNPEKLFPYKEHLFTITDYWMTHKTLLVPKSRQVSATWAFCALYLWESFFFAHRLTFFQSKKEADAEELILRTKQMYDSLPKWMRDWNPTVFISTLATFQRSKSRILGIPAGAQHIRGFNPSGVFVDEVSYVIEMDEVIRAIRPSLRGGGRLSLTSSPAPSFFQHMCLDTL